MLIKRIAKSFSNITIPKGLRLAFEIMIWVFLTYCCVFSTQHSDFFTVQDKNGYIVFSFFLFPFLMLAALYGYLISYISFVIAFIIFYVTNMSETYFMAVQLVAVTCFSLFSQYSFFKTKKNTAIAAVCTLLVTDIIEFVCFSIIQADNYDMSVLTIIFSYIPNEFMLMFLMAFMIYWFMNKTPDSIKTIFPLGRMYTKEYENNKELQRGVRKTRVSIKITVIIISIELILGFCVAFFMIALFPDLKKVVVGSIDQNNEIVSENTEESNKSTIISEIENLDFNFGDSAISYDLKMILLMLCVGVPLGGFANFYTKRTIGEPLGYMSDFMYEFANADDDKKKEAGLKVDSLNIKSRDEIGVVYQSMKSTVHSIEEYIERIEKEQKLEIDLEIAKKSSEAKSTFLSNMSHEIRTPINAVLGMNEMIIRETDDENILEYANNVKSAGNSLLRIINDILDFSKIEAGKMDIIPVQYNIGSTINDIINMISVKAQGKGLELEINIDKDIPSVLIGDELRIKQCVTNILTNAVKYTEKGTVTLNMSYRKIDDNNIMLRYQVIDTGIGIKDEDIGKLFSPFERIEEIRNRTIEGTGLGMSIVKKLLAMMDTRLDVKSVYGEGSDFSFEIKQEVVSWEELGDYKEKYKEYVKSIAKYHEKFKAPDAEILIVDDTEMNLMVVTQLLKTTRIKIDTATSGRQTLEMVQNKKYDAIFIDHRMPEMDGIETLDAMRTLEGNLNKDVPCIAFTANAGANARDEYISYGFIDYISKPVKSEDLEELLLKYLPQQKIQIMSAEDIDSEDTANAGTSIPEIEMLKKIDGISVDEAIANCGGEQILLNVIKDFYLSIDSKSNDIGRYADELDYRNYTVAVHALKSSARLIGADELSRLAAQMEECGNKEDKDSITQMTPELLIRYRGYKHLFADIEEDTAGQKDLPVIDVEELEQAYSDMKEVIEAYDFDTADGIMKMLSEYTIPEEYKSKNEDIRRLLALVDRDKLLEIL